MANSSGQIDDHFCSFRDARKYFSLCWKALTAKVGKYFSKNQGFGSLGSGEDV